MVWKPVENTLFLGNGFSRSIFQDMPSWHRIFEQVGVDSIISNNTILYEVFRLKAGEEGGEEAVKERLIQEIKAAFFEKSVEGDMRALDKFGEYLAQHHIYNIITTNYDNGIEFILCGTCGYREQPPEGMVPERIYSIRTHRVFFNEKTGHSLKLWKIHGDLDRIKSITLGFDQYCGSLSKLMNYVKGVYRSSQNSKDAECSVPMKEKCSNQKFDHLSWAELFFRTNLYIVGFGMDFSEIDIWWLLNKRARFMLEVPEINNSITYLYNVDHDKEDRKAEIFAALRAFQVSCVPIKSDSNYISSIFKNIK